MKIQQDFYVTLTGTSSEFIAPCFFPIELNIPYQVALIDVVFLKPKVERSVRVLTERGKVVKQVILPEGNGGGGGDLLAQINDLITFALVAHAEVAPRLVVDSDGRLRVQMGRLADGTALIIHLSNALADEVRQFDVLVAHAPKEAYDPVCCPWMFGEKTYHFLSIFCDLLDEHRTSDGIRPLLRTVFIPPELNAGEVCSDHYKHPVYLPLARSFVREIGITISEPFAHGYISLLLHFRPAP